MWVDLPTFCLEVAQHEDPPHQISILSSPEPRTVKNNSLFFINYPTLGILLQCYKWTKNRGALLSRKEVVSFLHTLFPDHTAHHVSSFCSVRAEVQTPEPIVDISACPIGQGFNKRNYDACVPQRAGYQPEANICSVLSLWKSERKQTPISQLNVSHARCPRHGDCLPCVFSDPQLRITLPKLKSLLLVFTLVFMTPGPGREGEEET